MRRRQLVDELFALGNFPPDQLERRIAELVFGHRRQRFLPAAQEKEEEEEEKASQVLFLTPCPHSYIWTFSCVQLFWIMLGVYVLPEVHKIFGAEHV